MPQRWTTLFVAAVLVAATAGVGAAQQEYTDELRAKAEQGDAEAQFDLGSIYEYGIGGVPQDQAEAVRWWRMAAEQGNLLAYYGLALQYFNGNGVPQDDVFAHMWANRVVSFATLEPHA